MELIKVTTVVFLTEAQLTSGNRISLESPFFMHVWLLLQTRTVRSWKEPIEFCIRGILVESPYQVNYMFGVGYC